jgi:tRNA threonylcarbamoyl adenosine modification protein (Sua5/YciO/YrdC/YwlC family)
MDLSSYVAALRSGQVIACPTETQIGLLADALDTSAVQRVCDMKRRPAGEPIPVLVPSFEAALQIALDVSGDAAALAAAHWPGPLTLVMRARRQLPAPLLRAGTIALRVPGPSPALELVRAFGGPLTATSANLSGQPPLTSEAELRATFGTALGGVVPGTAPGALPSTIVDVTGARRVVLRQGAIVLPD